MLDGNADPCPGKPETKHTLPVTLLRFARSAFIAPLLPRIFLIIFRYCQPVLINATVRFVNNGSQTENKPSFGSWLIVLTSVIYIGLAGGRRAPTLRCP
jgi:hypothetical protein